MTFCQSAGNHATVAAGFSVAATEIDSNKCRERKRKGKGGGREDEGGIGREGEEGPKGRERRKRREEKKKNRKRTAEAEAADTG